MRVILVGLGQEREDDSPVALLLVELVDGGDVVVGELKVEDGGVLLDPLRPGRLGHDGHAPLDVPPEQDLCCNERNELHTEKHFNVSLRALKTEYTGVDKRVGPRLRESRLLASSGRGARVHATLGPPSSRPLYIMA